MEPFGGGRQLAFPSTNRTKMAANHHSFKDGDLDAARPETGLEGTPRAELLCFSGTQTQARLRLLLYTPRTQLRYLGGTGSGR
jgi:hypothetical protein